MEALKQALRQFYGTVRKELMRLSPLIVIIALVVWHYGDYSQLELQAYFGALVAANLLIWHIVRKVMFPQADLQACALKARETSRGASIIWASTLAFLFGLIWLSAQFMTAYLHKG